MPHQFPDRLLPGEKLQIGEFLISSDDRYRVWMEADGSLVTYAYNETSGRIRYTQSQAFGAGAYLTMGGKGPWTINKSNGDIGVRARWEPPYDRFVNDIVNQALVIQSDGNLVQYGVHSGHQVSPFGLPDHVIPRGRDILIPNRAYTTVVAGTITVGSGQGDGEIVNKGELSVAVCDPNGVIVLPRDHAVSVTVAGTVSIETYDFRVDSLQGPNGGRLNRYSIDAVPVRAGGNRWYVDIGNGGSLFLRSPLEGMEITLPSIPLGGPQVPLK